MSYAAALHLHLRFAYATSPSRGLPAMVRSVRVKGIGLIAAADLTHPVWMEEIKHVLIPVEGGRFDVPDSAELAPSAAHCSIGPYR